MVTPLSLARKLKRRAPKKWAGVSMADLERGIRFKSGESAEDIAMGEYKTEQTVHRSIRRVMIAQRRAR